LADTERAHRLHHDVELVGAVYDAAPIGVAVWTVDGQLVHANPVFCQLVGAPRDELIGELFERFIHAGDAESIVGKIADLWAARRNFFECDLRCQGPDGSVLWLRAYLTPVYGVTGEPDYLISHVFDFAGRGARDAQLRRMANNTPVMLWLTDIEGRPRLGNRTCFEFIGVHQPSGDLGHVWADAIDPGDLAAARERIAPAIDAREPFEFVARSRRRDGAWRWLHHRANPIVGADGRFEGYAGASLDVTAAERARGQLRESQELFATLAEAGPVAVVRTDPEGRITYLNGRWADLVDDHERLLPDFGWRDLIRPEDVGRILELGIEAVVTRRPFTVRVRAFEFGDLTQRPGSDPTADPPTESPTASSSGSPAEYWGEVRAAPIFDGDDVHLGFVATVTDVSAEVVASSRADRLARVLDASADFVVIALPTGAVTYANGSVMDAFDPRVASNDAEGTYLWDLLDHDAVELYYEIIEPVLHEAGVWRGELTMRRKDGSVVPVSAQFLAHADELREGRLESISVVARDISEIEEVHEQLRHLATHDRLTGLANRALLYDRLDQALARANRVGGRVALLYLDLDRFKPVNDERGHDAGDRVLVEIARRIREVVRDTDTAARVGGDEFAVLVEGVGDLGLVEAVASRLLESVGDPIDIGSGDRGGEDVTVTASIGLVFAPPGCDDGDQLMNLADRTMYRAKASGRSRVEVLDAGTSV
jgi:diguanylate cyclase (GGDEF)-like protein/PAS domain S-box-containing protein